MYFVRLRTRIVWSKALTNQVTNVETGRARRNYVAIKLSAKCGHIISCHMLFIANCGSSIVETHISDHYLVFATLNLRRPKPSAAYVVARSYKYYDPQSFLSDLNKI